jgi:hypothetical protein
MNNLKRGRTLIWGDGTWPSSVVVAMKISLFITLHFFEFLLLVKFLYTYLKFVIDHVTCIALIFFYPHPFSVRKVRFIISNILKSNFVI